MDITGIITWIVLGLVMGYLARALVPGEQKIGLIPTLIVGALGAFLGAFVGKYLGIEVHYFNWMSLLAALVGAIVVLCVWCLIFRRKI